MDDATALTALRALSQDSRLAAFRLLVQAGPAGLPVGSLREALALPPATLSAHLNVLRAAGLAVDAREGRVIRVRANYARMNELLGFLTENCCQGAPCAPTDTDASAVCAPTENTTDCCVPTSSGETA